MKTIGYRIKENVTPCSLRNFGFVYLGNWARGNLWQKKIPELKDKGEGVEVNFDLGRDISYILPYMNIAYLPIEDYIKDLLDAGYAEPFEKEEADEYVRLKDDVCRLQEIRDKEIVVLDKEGDRVCLSKKKMIQRSERLEDLFEEYVFTKSFPENGYQHGEIVTEGFKNDPCWSLKESVRAALEAGENTHNIYGAIWTKSGLKFVAKMTKSGAFGLCDEYGDLI